MKWRASSTKSMSQQGLRGKMGTELGCKMGEQQEGGCLQKSRSCSVHLTNYLEMGDICSYHS